VILQAPRLLLSVAVFAVILSSPSAIFAQTPTSMPLTLPDAPHPQPDAALPAADSATPDNPATALVADSYSSSILSMPEEQAQTDAQTSSQTTPPPDHPLTDAEKKQAAEAQLQQELKQRMAGVVPNFNAVLGGNALPLSPGQKMRAAFRSAIDPYQFGLALITSGYGQATDSHSSIDANGTRHGYPQGWAGYGCRYGANYVDQFNGTIIGNGILPVLLHQDARYFRMGKGSFKKRFFYSLSTTVVAHGDNGKLQPNYSNVLGNLISGGISNIYYPRAERGFALTVEQGITVTAEGSFGALLIEFYPDIRRHFSKKNHAQTAP
jgi:hypothetical protein